MRRSPLTGLPREVAVLTAVSFSVAVGFGIVAPAIPVFAKTFGVNTTAASAVISVFALTRLLSAPLAGRLVNRLGERIVLATGIGIVAISSALAGLSQSYVQLIALRGFGGVGSAMFSVSALSLLLRSVAPEQRGRASGLFSGGFLIGGISGPALGGIVTGVSFRLPFFLYAGLLAVPGAIGLAFLSRTRLAEKDEGAGVQRVTSLRTALGNRAYVAALAAQFGDGWAALAVRSALLPLFVQQVLHRKPIWTGIGFALVAAVNAATLLPASRAADDRGRRPVLAGGCALSGLGMAILAIAPSLGGYLVGLTVLGVGSGLLDVAPAAVVGDVVEGRGGSVIAVFQMSSDGGAVVGPVLAGRLVDIASYSAAFGLTAGVLAVAVVLALAAPETRVSPALAPDPP